MHKPDLFQFGYFQLKHHKQDITRSKTSYSLIESQPLPFTAGCGHKFHALTFHPHPTFTAPLVESAFRIQSEVCGGAVLQKKSTCFGHWLFSQRSSVIDVLQLCLRRFSTTGVTQGNFELLLLPVSPDSHQSQIQ